jgi:predicted nucleic acid-binding protein
MRILIDTNVLLRSIELGQSHHQSSVSAVDLLRKKKHDLCIVPQVLYEFWSVATRPIENNGLGMTPIDAHSEIILIQKLFHLLRDERGVYAYWEQLVSSHGVRGKQAHDARIAAAMQRHSVTHLLTFNTADFARFSFVTAVSPVSIMSGSLTVGD